VSLFLQIDIGQKRAMDGLRELSNSTAFLTKEMSKNTMCVISLHLNVILLLLFNFAATTGTLQRPLEPVARL
jgi:hypothetical protein